MTDPTIPAGHRDGAAGGARESRVSRICKELDEVVEPFRHRPISMAGCALPEGAAQPSHCEPGAGDRPRRSRER
jgi:hypothetical protein